MNTTTREQTVKQLLEIRENAVEEINRASVRKVGTQWMADRIKDIEYANRQLARLGAIQA